MVINSYDTNNKDVFSLLKEAIESAKPDFCIIADNNSRQYLKEYGEHIVSGCTILSGIEITHTDDEGNHILALNASAGFEIQNEPQKNIDALNAANALSFICHPVKFEKNFFLPKDVSWKKWDAVNFTGIEIWDYMSYFLKELSFSSILIYSLFPKWVVNEPAGEAIAKWEEINRLKKCPAIGSVDARLKKFIPFFFNKVFNYNFLFNTIRTNIFTDKELTCDIGCNKNIIYSALKKGNSYIVNYEVGNPANFRFYAEYNKKTYIPGNTVNIDQGFKIIFSIKTPMECEITLFCNYEIIACAIDNDLDYITDMPGNYRVEISYAKRKWILTNFIYVKKNISG